MNKRPPDAENCIKDAVGAMEGMGRLLANSNRTLGQILPALAQSLDIHPTLSAAISKLYGYRGDEGGVAHGAIEALGDHTAEAELVVHWCAAAIVYLEKKGATMTANEVRAKLGCALASFFRDDHQLLESGVREEALSHRIACHLREHFPAWVVDAEYDKLHIDGTIGKKKYVDFSGVDRGAVPDIIIHQRQKSRNLVAIEVKRFENRRGRKRDFDKLRAYKEPPYSYLHAVFLEVGLVQGSPHVKIELK